MKKSNGKTSVLYNSLTSIVSIAIVAEKYLRRMPRSKYDSNVVLDGNKSLLPDNTLLTCLKCHSTPEQVFDLRQNQKYTCKYSLGSA